MEIRVAVLLPTFNNSETLPSLIDEIRRQCSNVIVINDGSTDVTNELLRNEVDVTILTNHENSGKGASLRMGFEYAYDEGFTHVITIDADSIYSPNDISNFLIELENDTESLMIGSEFLGTVSPEEQKRKRFRRVLGNTLIRLFTGFKLTDVHSSFRSYPLSSLEPLELKSNNFEYEQEVLIEAAWAGVPLKEIAISEIHRDPNFVLQNTNFRDFCRLTKVHARASFRHFFTPFSSLKAAGNTTAEKMMNIVRRELTKHTTPLRASAAFALGVFMGIFPIHGFQVIVLMLLASRLKLNRPIAFLGVNVSIPPLLPILIVSAIKVGDLVLPGRVDMTMVSNEIIKSGGEGFVAFIVGSVILAPLLSIVAFILSYPLFSTINRKKQSS